jgi:hypothetical protein
LTNLVLTNLGLTRGHGSLLLDSSFFLIGHICYTRISGVETLVPSCLLAGVKSSVKLH